MVWNHFRYGLIDPNQVMKRAAMLLVGFATPFAASHYFVNYRKRKDSEEQIPTDRRDIGIASGSSLRMRIEYDNSLRHRDDFSESTDLYQDRLGVERELMNEKQKGEDLLIVFIGDMWSTTDMYRPLRDELLRRYKDYKVHCIAIQRFGYGIDASKWFSYIKSMPNHSKLIDKAIEYAYSQDVIRETLKDASGDESTNINLTSKDSIQESLPPRGSRNTQESRGGRTATHSSKTMSNTDDFSIDREFSQYGAENTSNTRRRILFVGHGLGAYLARGYIHGVCHGTNDHVAAVLIDPLTEFHGDSMEWKTAEAHSRLKYAYTNYANLGLMEWLSSPRIPMQTHIKQNFLNHFSDFPDPIQKAIRYAICDSSFWKTGFEELESFNLMTRKFIPKKMTNIHDGFKYNAVIVNAEDTQNCDREHWKFVDEDAYNMIIGQEFIDKSVDKSLVRIPDKNHNNVLYSLGLVDVISSKIDEFFELKQEST